VFAQVLLGVEGNMWQKKDDDLDIQLTMTTQQPLIPG